MLEAFPMAGVSLLDHCRALDDPRQPGKVLYPLPEVMLPVLCATLAGATSSSPTTLAATKADPCAQHSAPSA